jgi:predicted enzyme related to lactoylglutathione lyase
MMCAMRLVCVLDCRDPARLAQFWAEAIGYTLSSSGGPYVVLIPRDGDGPELVLQRVAEPKATKNRMHLDIRTGQLEATVHRLVGLGACRLQPGITEEAGFRWVVMTDPEGNEFCVCTEP